MKPLHLFLAVLAALLVAGGCFIAYQKYDENKKKESFVAAVKKAELEQELETFEAAASVVSTLQKMLGYCFEEENKPCDWKSAGFVETNDNPCFSMSETPDGGMLLLKHGTEGCEAGSLIEARMMYGANTTVEITSDYSKCVELIKKYLK